MHIDMTMSAKAFCNLYHKFYYAGQASQLFKLIRYKYIQSSMDVTIPWMQSGDPNGGDSKHKT